MPTVVVQLEPKPAAKPRRGPSTRATAPLAIETEAERLAGALGHELRPLHAGSADPVLGSYHVIEVADAKAAAEVAARARQLPGVKAAYVKPSDEAP
jgi:hypothetical protein